MIEIDFSQEQSDALHYLADSETNRVLYGGQAGGGKSFLISMWQISQRINYPETRGYIGREILKNLKNSIAITLFDCLKQLNVPYSYNDQKSHIDFPNGSRIIFLDLFEYPSDPNFESLGSTEYTDGAIEEGGNISKRMADLLLTRTRYKHDVYNIHPKQLITCNPADSWIKHEIIIPYHENRLKPTTKYVPATLASNPNKDFAQRYRKTLEQMDDPFDKARLLNGDWFVLPKTGGEFYRSYKHDIHVVDTGYDPKLPIHITFDFNVVPYITATVWQMIGKQMIQIDEFCLTDPLNNTPALCRAIMDKYHDHQSGLFVYGDPSGKQRDTRSETGHNDFDLIRIGLTKLKPIMRVEPSAPSVLMRGNFINAIFEFKMENISISINKNCVNSIDDLNFVKMDADGTKLKQKFKDRNGVAFEKYGHTSDAMDYFVCSALKSDFTTFMRGDGVKSYNFGKRVINRKY